MESSIFKIKEFIIRLILLLSVPAWIGGCNSTIVKPREGFSISWLYAHSSDPSILMFNQDDDEKLTSEVYLYNTRNGRRVPLYASKDPLSPLGWRQDGDHLVILSRGQCFWLNIRTGEKIVPTVTEREDAAGLLFSAALSPSGRYLGEIVLRTSMPKAANIWVTDLRSGESKAITYFTNNDWGPSVLGDLSWSKDEKWLYFTMENVVWRRFYNYPEEVPEKYYGKRQWWQAIRTVAQVSVEWLLLWPDVAGGTDASCVFPTVSPKGRAIAYLRSRSLYDLWRLDLVASEVGGREYVLLRDVDAFVSPRWSADMRYIYVKKNGSIVRVSVPKRLRKEIMAQPDASGEI